MIFNIFERKGAMSRLFIFLVSILVLIGSAQAAEYKIQGKKIMEITSREVTTIPPGIPAPCGLEAVQKSPKEISCTVKPAKTIGIHHGFLHTVELKESPEVQSVTFNGGWKLGDKGIVQSSVTSENFLHFIPLLGFLVFSFFSVRKKYYYSLMLLIGPLAGGFAGVPAGMIAGGFAGGFAGHLAGSLALGIAGGFAGGFAGHLAGSYGWGGADTWSYLMYLCLYGAIGWLIHLIYHHFRSKKVATT
jgi:hypothetical protein